MILFYGCWTDPQGRSDTGHYFRTKTGDDRIRRRMNDGRLSDRPEEYVPWGWKVDGVLAPRAFTHGQMAQGIAAFHQAREAVPTESGWMWEGWSALAWWDNSVDTRPGSNCVFLVDRLCMPEELLVEAREAFPQIFARFKYGIILPGPIR